jgi:hypothetical protein
VQSSSSHQSSSLLKLSQFSSSHKKPPKLQAKSSPELHQLPQAIKTLLHLSFS